MAEEYWSKRLGRMVRVEKFVDLLTAEDSECVGRWDGRMIYFLEDIVGSGGKKGSITYHE